MKTKIYSLIILCAGLFFSGHTNAQCGLHYVDKIFTVDTTTVTYSAYDSTMDIYQPVGDTTSKRPLIVLAHEGTFITGNKSSDPTVVRLCNNFAARGYVVASINYRLIQSLIDFADSTNVITEVIQALSDGKAAVRYFSKDAATNNIYRIDTNKMFIGGNSAGAVLAMHYGYIDSVGQVPPYLQAIINANGGLEGNSGNAGYTSKVAGVISCAGGLNNAAWVTPGDVPSFNAQGTADDVVPYYCANAEGGAIMVRLCGLGSLQPYYTSAGINESSLLFPGAPHVPWVTSASMFYAVDWALDMFLSAHFVTPDSICVPTTGINNVTSGAKVNLYPNPATDQVNLRSSVAVTSITICDETGRQVRFIGNLNNLVYQINTTDLSKGVYFVKLEVGSNMVPLVKRVVLE